MQLKSDAFGDGDPVPQRFTCEGADISPPLQWSGAPKGTRSFAILCTDPDAPGGIWHHWAAYDLAPTSTSLPEAFGAPWRAEGFKQAVNDFGNPGYGGPCPPHGHGTHHYHFRLLALAVDHLQLRKDPTCRDVEREARKHLLAEATLIGWYER